MDNFVNRLEFLLQHYEFTASTFADKIGVQRSSLSHLLSGRNKPSLDLIMKIYDAFPELNLYWLLKGEGVYTDKNSTSTAAVSPSLFSETNEITSRSIPVEISKSSPLETVEQPVESSKINSKIEADEIAAEEKTAAMNPPKTDLKKICSTREIEQIVIFYKDGSFSNYLPN